MVLDRQQEVRAQTERRLAEGRGKGFKEHYKPWIYVSDISSLGQSARIWSDKVGRVVQLLSQLEQHAFYLYEWSPSVVDIREQFPLPLDSTLALAQELGIAHPSKWGVPIVMTTDFLLTVDTGVGQKLLARALKYSWDCKPRTKELLHLERAYWEMVGVDWRLVTERGVPAVVVGNVMSVRPRRNLPLYLPFSGYDIPRIARALTDAVVQSDDVLAYCALRCDTDLGLGEGDSLAVARYLIATRQWTVDMGVTIDPGQPLVLRSVALASDGERRQGLA